MAGPVSSRASTASARKPKIVVISEFPVWHETWQKWLSPDSYDVKFVATPLAWLEEAPTEEFQVAIFHYTCNFRNAMSILKLIKKMHPLSEVIVCGPEGSPEEAFRAGRAGAFDYVPPCADPERFQTAFLHALAAATVSQVETTVEKSGPVRFHKLLAQSNGMKTIFAEIERFAPLEMPIMITGESGTGKELVAEAIHQSSRRSAGPFIRVNSASISPALLESELFGHVKGAFTGAQERRKGLFELANGGTLLLDEIGDMDKALQPKVLRAIEEKEIWPVGAEAPVKINVRFIAATNQDLLKLIGEGRFRNDLLYRLDAVTIDMPPLRNRQEDIPVLAKYFLDVHGKERSPAVVGISNKALDQLICYPWPGNVRELINVMKNAIATTRGPRIEPDSLRFRRGAAREPRPVNEVRPMAEAQKDMIQAALRLTNGDKKRAAEILKISVKTLHRKVKQWK